MTGLVRSEWAVARYGQVIPCNWSQTDSLMWLEQFSPLGFLVADARNMAVKQCLDYKFDWLFFIDHDVVLPPHTIVTWNERMLDGKIPMWAGLYFTKSVPSEPLVYRGRGTGYYIKWKLGDKVWVDGIPMGCTMIHSSILRVVWDDSEEYEAGGFRLRRAFETPAKVFTDPETQSWFTVSGTEDLNFCNKLIEKDYLAKAGWPEYQKKKYPFLIDTSVFCKHIDFDGIQYPSRGEEAYFKR
jgi:hypothetical protein